ncbi:MAG TPA: hypothetical protein VE865_06830, partial [Bradyrhizobium sp.]|nr:hypothetical protein [Bradyrhizobium sp.]
GLSRSNKCEEAASAATNLQRAKTVDCQKPLLGKPMPILFYIAIWSCALGMASSLAPLRVREGDDRE